jgi:hypothetical protein
MQRLGKYIPMVTNMHTTIEELVKVMFHMQSPLKLHKEDQQDQDSQSSLAAWLPEWWDSKIWSQVPLDLAQRMTVLVRASSNLPEQTKTVIHTVAYRPTAGQRPWNGLQVQPLLCNRQINKHSFLGNDSINGFLQQWMRYCWTVTLETVFPMWFMPKCYKQGQSSSEIVRVVSSSVEWSDVK